MAIASVGTLGTASASGSGGTIAFSPSAQLDSGNVGMLVVVSDNLQTTDGDKSDVTGVADTVGNVYTKVGEYTNGEGAAAAGVTCSVWMTKASSNLTTGGTVTVTFASAPGDRTASFWEFTVGAPLSLSQAVTSNATDASNDYGSVTISGLPSKSRLYFRGLAKEANSTGGINPSTGFSVITAARSRSNPNAVVVRGEFRINTSTGETSNPTFAVTGDTAAVFAALEETYTGAAAFTAKGSTLAATATFTPKSTGTSALVAKGATLAASGTVSSVAVTATAALTAGHATLAAVAYFAYQHPVGSLTYPRVGRPGTQYGSFASKETNPPISTGVGTLVAAPATLSTAATFSFPHTVGDLTYPHVGRPGARYGSFSGKGSGTFTAAVGLTAGHATLAATATFTAPTYAGTAGLAAGHATLAGTASHVVPTYTGSGSLTAGHAALAAVAAFSPPTVTASASLTATGATLSAVASMSPPTFTAAAGLTAKGGTLTAVVGFTAPTYAGIGSLVARGSVLASVASMSPPSYTASAGLTAKGATLAGGAIFGSGVFQAAGTLVSAPAALDATGSHIVPIFMPSAVLVAKGAALVAVGSFVKPTYHGLVALVSGHATLASSGVFASTLVQATATLTASPAGLDAEALGTSPIPTPPVPGTLPGAIVERFDASPDCSFIDGGLTHGVASQGSSEANYYAEFFLVAEGYNRFVGGYLKRCQYQFNCYGASDKDADLVAEAILGVFNAEAIQANNLRFARGKATTALPMSGSDDPDDFTDENGKPRSRRHFDVMFRVNPISAP